ncbi:MAG TPA: response regulator [Vineibacter sp.]|nr:response regulator [Vineibacter sp.]
MADDIFIVDDDEAVRDSLRALFEAYGYCVHDFSSGADFLRSHGPTLRGCVLLDVNLPGIDGFEVLKAMVEQGSALAVIIMTARTDSRTSAHAVEAGAIGFVQKPFVTTQLVSLVRGALNGRP